MFKKTKLIAILFIFFNFFISMTSFAYDRFAKIVLIGQIGSGKTVLYNLLTHSNKGINDITHTKQISTNKMEYNIDDNSICVYLNDTPGEVGYKNLVNAFCHNANVVFITVDAVDFVRVKMNYRGKINHLDDITDNLENLIGELYKYNPNCRVVVVMTKMGMIGAIYEHENSKKWKVVQSSLKHYIEDLSYIEDNVDETYDLTLFDTKSKEAIDHRTKLENIIKECLRKYGIDKLPDTPDEFRAEIVKKIAGYKKVVDEEAGTCSSEKSHIETKYENKLYVK